MGDISEGAAVHKSGRVLKRLHQVGLDGIFEERRHGTLGLEVRRGDGLAAVGVCHHHAAQARLEVHEVARQAERRHNLGRDRDIKAILARHALHLAAQAIHNVAELTIVHIDRTLPGDGLRIDAKGIALLNVVVEHGREEVVGRADSMEVAREVQIDILHGNHLSVTAASSTALDAKDRAE